MTEGRPTVLLVGFDDAVARRVVVLLSPLGVHFHRLSWEVVVARPIWLVDAEVVLVHYRGDRSGLAWLVSCENWSSEGARGGAVVVLCPASGVAEAESTLSGGPHRVIPLEELEERLRHHVASLLGLARRYRIRVPIRLEPVFAAGAVAAGGHDREPVGVGHAGGLPGGPAGRHRRPVRAVGSVPGRAAPRNGADRA